MVRANQGCLDPRDNFSERPFPPLGPEERGKDGGWGEQSPVRAGSREEGPGPTRVPTTKSKGVGKHIPPALSFCWCLLGEVRRLGSQMMKFEGASSQGTEKGREYMGEGQANGE